MPEDDNTKRSSLTSEGFKDLSSSSVKQTAKATSGQSHLNVPLDSSFRPSLESLSNFSSHSLDYQSEDERVSRSLLTYGGARLHSTSPVPGRSWRCRLGDFWAGNKGLMLVILSQMFGSLMSVTTRLLETDGKHGRGMHPFQVVASMPCIVIGYLLSSTSRSCLPE